MRKNPRFVLIPIITALLLSLFGESVCSALPLSHMGANNPYAIKDDCAGCHLPRKKAPDTGHVFPVNPTSDVLMQFGSIGTFCMERCHLNVSGGTGDGGDLIYADTTRTVAKDIGGGPDGVLVGSHGLNRFNGGRNAPYGTIVSSQLPYGKDNPSDPMECTSCHNVHSDDADSSNALMRVDMDMLCTRCHTLRVPDHFNGIWGPGYGPENPGSHPVGRDVKGDFDLPADSRVRIGVGNAYGSTAFDHPYGGDTFHNLGGHLFDGAVGQDGNSPLSCVTCHAVHGVQNDPGDKQPLSGGPVSEDLLVVRQSPLAFGAEIEPDYHASGDGDMRNALCEGCHTHDGASPDNWNPGATPYSHPADSMEKSLNMGNIATTDVVNSTGEWPFGPPTGIGTIGMGPDSAGGGPRVICESCHTPHPRANSGHTGYTGVPPSGTHILRREDSGLCAECHTGSPPGHHPSGTGVLEAPAANFGDIDIYDGDGTLTCGDCHEGRGAHNWPFNHMPGLDPDWEPNGLTSPGRGDLMSDNGRSFYEQNAWNDPIPAISPGTHAIVYPGASKECFDCHLADGTYSPTRGTAGGSDGNNEYEPWGDGSHFLGDTRADYLVNGLYLGAPFNPLVGDWNESASITYYSKYGDDGAGNPEIVCESCHGLRMVTFTGDDVTRANQDKLLVTGYSEGKVRQNTNVRYESGLCEGCHNKSIGDSGHTHVMTGDFVDRRSRTGYTSGVLTTDLSLGFADQEGAPNDCEYPEPDALNCDSCHQPHDAASNSGSFILDIDSTRVKMAEGVSLPRSSAVTLYGGAYSRSHVSDNRWGDRQSADGAADSFCSQCHDW